MKSQHAKQRACVIVVGLFSTLAGLAQAGETPIGAPQDWSNRAVIYRNAKTPDELLTAGRSADMNRLYRDPRYVASVLRRVEAEGRRPALPAQGIRNPHEDRHRPRTPAPSLVNKDWSNVLGGGTDGMGGSGLEGTYPAKYNFDITAAPSCANDFVVYPTNAGGSTSSGSPESWTGTFTGAPNNGQTVTIGLAGTRQLVLTASNSNNLDKNFIATSNNTQNATNLAAAVNRWSSQTGYTATSSGASVTISGATTGNTNDSAVTETLLNFADGTWWWGGRYDDNWVRTQGTGTAGQPTIIAFDQLYQGTGACSGAWNNYGAVKAPRVKWAYNTGTGYSNETSPSLSYLDDGKQVAFVQRNAGTLQLILLKWTDGQGTAAAPATPTDYGSDAAGYRSCTGGCLLRWTIQSGGPDSATWSSPFVDYNTDTLWVGDTTGHLHKFTGVFQGIPTRATAVAGITIENGMKLGSPVSDGTNVYVGSQSGDAGIGGKLFRINAANGVILATSAKLARDNTIGLRASPIVDMGTNYIFTFVFNDNSTAYPDTTRCAAFASEIDGCRAVFQFPTNFTNNSTGNRQLLGRGNGVTRTLWEGTFDDAYYNSNGTGAMYIVGGRQDNTFYATLWKIPFVNGVMQPSIKGAEVGARDRYSTGTTDNPQILSPTTVIKDTNLNQEYLFFSTASYANAAGCGSGVYASSCMYMFNLNDLNGSAPGTGSAWGTSNVPSAALATGTGTSGIVVDNVNNSTTGARQVYFSNTGSTGNAVQASQDALN